MGASPGDCDVVFFIDADGGFVVGLVVLSGTIGMSSLGTFVSAGAPVVCVVDGISVFGAPVVPLAHAAVIAQMHKKGINVFIRVSPRRSI
ncbi:MAG: hypothetical protein ABI183_13420 [Polyangiaceae bacterium]